MKKVIGLTLGTLSIIFFWEYILAVAILAFFVYSFIAISILF